MVLSQLPSAPAFSVGTSLRKKHLKQYVSNELAKTNLIGNFFHY